MSGETTRRDLSLKSRVAIAAAVCLLLPISMWIVLFLSNRSVEERLTKSQRDLARVSGLRGLISLTEKVTTPVLNAADYGSDIEDRESEYKDAAAGAGAGIGQLEGLFTPEEAAASGFADLRTRLLGTVRDAARILEILKDPALKKSHEAEFDELRSSLSGKSGRVIADLRKMVEGQTRAAGEGLLEAQATSVRSGRVALLILVVLTSAVWYIGEDGWPGSGGYG